MESPIRISHEPHIILIKRLAGNITVMHFKAMSVLPLRDILHNSVISGSYTQGMDISIPVFPPLLQDNGDFRIIRIAERLQLRKTGTSYSLMPYIRLEIIDKSLRTAFERDPIKNLGHRILGVADRFRKRAQYECTLTYDIHVDNADSLQGLDVSLNAGAISAVPFFREDGIVGLGHSSHNCKHIVGTPIIAFRCGKGLSGLHGIPVTEKFVKVFDPSSDDTGLLHGPYAPFIHRAIFVERLNYMILST